MNKAVFSLALLSVICLSFAADVEDAVEESVKSRYYKKKCPCRCFIGHKVYIAEHQCKKHWFLYHCEVSDCKPKYYYHDDYYGKWCCDKPSPSPTPTPSVTPTPTPSQSPKKKPPCPCKCVSYYRAKWMCKKYYYYPYCVVKECPYEPYYHHEHKYGYKYRPRKKYECCYH